MGFREGKRKLGMLRNIFRVTAIRRRLEWGLVAAGIGAGVAIVVLSGGYDVKPAGTTPVLAAAAAVQPAPTLPVFHLLPVGPPKPDNMFAPRLSRSLAVPAEPVTRPSAPPAWRLHAAIAPEIAGRPVIAVIIDDMGIDRPRSARAARLPAPLTLAYLPYARKLRAQTAEARARGHELLVHLPMEALRGDEDPGPNALLDRLDPGELRRRLVWSLRRFPGFVGVNNHMGSRLTRDGARMALVMVELKKRGLLFVDSRTSIRSVAARVAREARVPTAERDVFLDHVDDPEAVRVQLRLVEQLARLQGFAVAIGHPRDATLDALKNWIGDATARGFVLVPVSSVIRRDHPLG